MQSVVYMFMKLEEQKRVIEMLKAVEGRFFNLAYLRQIAHQ